MQNKWLVKKMVAKKGHKVKTDPSFQLVRNKSLVPGLKAQNKWLVKKRVARKGHKVKRGLNFHPDRNKSLVLKRVVLGNQSRKGRGLQKTQARVRLQKAEARRKALSLVVKKGVKSSKAQAMVRRLVEMLQGKWREEVVVTGKVILSEGWEILSKSRLLKGVGMVVAAVAVVV